MRTLFIIIGFVFAITFASCATRVIVQPSNIKVIKVAPKHHKIIVIKGKRYYFWNGRHYKRTKEDML